MSDLQRPSSRRVPGLSDAPRRLTASSKRHSFSGPGTPTGGLSTLPPLPSPLDLSFRHTLSPRSSHSVRSHVEVTDTLDRVSTSVSEIEERLESLFARTSRREPAIALLENDLRIARHSTDKWRECFRTLSFTKRELEEQISFLDGEIAALQSLRRVRQTISRPSSIWLMLCIWALLFLGFFVVLPIVMTSSTIIRLAAPTFWIANQRLLRTLFRLFAVDSTIMPPS